MYLILPKIKVERANAMSAWWLVAPPGPMTAFGFVHALSRKLQKHPASFILIHHDFHLLAEVGRYSISPYQQKDPTENSMQPMSLCNTEITLALYFPDEFGMPSDDAINGIPSLLLSHMRYGGGQITGFGIPTKVTDENLQAALLRQGSGFVVHDRTDLVLVAMESEKHSNSVEAIMSIMHRNRTSMQKTTESHYSGEESGSLNHEEEAESWLHLNTVGHSLLNNPALSIGRNGSRHAYAEPLVGLLQYTSLRNSDFPHWSYKQSENNFFVTTPHP